ncbi:MAG: hypothetical protein N3G75_07705 [Methanothrix sp.]|nr:hypothetical protein [Methanothrix sp.]MCX8207699.1 hypothetical protein [Methanothrix sp.]
MNYELLHLIRESGYLTDADLNANERYALLTHRFWKAVEALGYDTVRLKRTLWMYAGRPEEDLVRALPESPIQKAVRQISSQSTGRDRDRQDDIRRRIKEIAASITEMYQRGEKAIQESIDRNLDNPERLRSETDRIRRMLLAQAASWLAAAVPGLYVTGARIGTIQLHGPHADAVRALITQELNRFRELDAQIGRHIEEVIAEAEKRRVQAALANREPDYSGLRGKVVGYRTIEGRKLGVSDYVKMLALTASRDFYNLGTQNGMLHRKEDLALISREVRRNTCDACRRWAGRIVSISGRSAEYPSLQDALDDGIMHPHCIHYLIPVDYPGST